MQIDLGKADLFETGSEDSEEMAELFNKVFNPPAKKERVISDRVKKYLDHFNVILPGTDEESKLDKRRLV